MKELRCKNCGAPLVKSGPYSYKCEHCGSLFAEEGARPVEFFCVQEARAVPLTAKIEVPFEASRYMDEEAISEYSIREVTRKLAEGLAAYMKLDVEKDPYRMATIVRGTVRVVPPDHRF